MECNRYCSQGEKYQLLSNNACTINLFDVQVKMPGMIFSSLISTPLQKWHLQKWQWVCIVLMKCFSIQGQTVNALVNLTFYCQGQRVNGLVVCTLAPTMEKVALIITSAKYLLEALNTSALRWISTNFFHVQVGIPGMIFWWLILTPLQNHLFNKWQNWKC